MQNKPQTLTPTGISKIINDKNFVDPVLQIIEFKKQQKMIGKQAVYCSQISDGYAKLRCYFCSDLIGKIDENPEQLNNQIIKLKKYGATIKSILIYNYEVVIQSYPQVIGNPIPYKDFLTGGNPASNNLIVSAKIPPKQKQPSSNSNKKPILATDPPTSKKRAQLVDPNELDMIADLYPDMHNWKIYCRVAKVNYSEFKAKSGNQTKLLAMELMDRRGSTIKATIFGDYAEKMSKTVEVGDTYTFSKGLVKMDNYRRGNSTTSSQYTIIFTEVSRMIPTADDHSIKNPDAIYLTVSDLKMKDPNTEVDVVGIVKEIKNSYDINAKSGNKTLRKRTIVICDPINKVEIDAVFWNELTEIDENLLYKPVLLLEFRIHEYNGSISINSSIRSKVIELKDHPLKEYQLKVGSQQYQTISFRRDDNGKVIRNIQGIEQQQKDLPDDTNLWADLRVFVNRIRDKQKKTYDGCPFCKKTVQPDDTICSNCSKKFTKPQTRYILSIQISDYTGSLWTTAYDQFAERIFKVAGNYPAQMVKNFTDRQFEELTKVCLFQEFKIKTISKYQISTDGQRRIKHNVAKVYPIDNTAEAKSNLEYISKRI